MSPGYDLINGGKAGGIAKNKGPVKQGDLGQKAEETKINFFDANAYDQNHLELKGKYEMPEKTDENKIIEACIDPLEWKLEIDRVYKELNNLEKDIEIMIKNGGSGGSGESFEECRRHIELIIEMCNDIKQSSHH